MDIDWDNLPMREPLQTLLSQEPFQPFRIHMTGGYTCEVQRPESTRLGKTTLAIGAWDDSASPPRFVERSVLAIYHINRLEPLLSDEPTIVQGKGD